MAEPLESLQKQVARLTQMLIALAIASLGFIGLGLIALIILASQLSTAKTQISQFKPANINDGGEPSKPIIHEELVTRSLVVVDSQERSRFRLYVFEDPDDENISFTLLQMGSPEGKPRVALVASEEAGQVVLSSGKTHWERVELAAEPTGGVLRLFDSSGDLKTGMSGQ